MNPLYRSCRTIIFALCCLLFSTPIVASDNGSFSPIYLTNARGKPIKLSWTYVVNQGRPLLFNQRGIRLTFRFGALQVTINPKTLKRESALSARVSGVAQGSVTVRVIEDLQPLGEGTILVGNQRISLTMDISAQGQSATVAAKLVSTMTPPSEWFLDRADLDILGVGYVHDENNLVSTRVTGSVCIAAQGQRECSRLNGNSISPERWEITGSSPAMRVRSTSYSNVVVVDRTTLVPSFSNLFDGSGPDTEPATITYWVAKGVGMVKGIGQYRFLGEPLLVELKNWRRR